MTFRRFALSFLAIWLPIASSLASTMVVADSVAVRPSVDVAHHGEAAGHSMPCHDTVADAEGASTCPHCALCHIIGAMIATDAGTTATLPMASAQGEFVETFDSFIPSSAQRPPSQSLV